MKPPCAVFVLIWYICVNENYLFTRAEYNTVSIDLNDKSRKISCNSSRIYIHTTYVREESVPCTSAICKLNEQDISAVKKCNGKHDCNIDWKFTSACILEYGYFNMSYICKASCDFDVDTCQFETDPLDINHRWKRVKSFNIPAPDNTNTTLITDHTTGYGYFMMIISKTNGTGKMKSPEFEFETGGPKCLSFWYFSFGKGQTISLNLYNTAGYLRFLELTQTEEWLYINENIYLEETDYIILQTDFNKDDYVGVALDDVSLSHRSCEDDVHVVESCLLTNKSYTFNEHDECPSILISELNITHGMSRSDPLCQNISQKVQEIVRHCSENMEPCEFILTDLTTEKTCFQLQKTIIIEYSCTDTTASVTKWTQTVSTTPQTDNITESFQSVSPSSTPVIGIVVGVVLSLIALSVFLVIAVVYFRRSRYAEKKANSTVVKQNNHIDYTGHQNVAFSPEVNGNTQTDYYEIRTSKHNEQYHDISDTFSPLINTEKDDEYSEIANVVNSPNSNPNASTNYQHQYITLDPNAAGFNRSNSQTNLNNESKPNHNSNEKTSFTGGDDYVILDPDDLNESKNNTTKVLPLSDNYVVLDPNETGFNRKENTDRVLATPTVTSEDPYDVSKDETYDTSSNSRHKEQENNIYSHTVDNVYDTAGNQRKKDENDGTYDHFFGQKSEDDYDISKPI